ncbi:MAG: WG repeat-containing protein, partial [Bacteroidota bacterium]
KEHSFYIDKQGKEVFGRRFQRRRLFSDGMAAVQFNGKWGYINKQGELIIPAIFEEAWDFEQGLARIVSDYQAWAYINKQGEYVFKQRNFEAPEEMD